MNRETIISVEARSYTTAKVAADELGYTPSHVRRLCRGGKLTGLKEGRDWWVLISDLERLKREKRP